MIDQLADAATGHVETRAVYALADVRQMHLSGREWAR